MTVIDLIQEPSTYAEDFAAVAGAPARAFAPLRREAFDRFMELGFPTTRDEEWRFTNVAPIARTAFRLAARDGRAAADVELPAWWRLDSSWPTLVFVNGWVSERLSTAPGVGAAVRAENMASLTDGQPDALRRHLGRHATCENDAFVALNTAFLADGAHVRAPAGILVERPVHLVYLSAPGRGPAVCHPRTLIVAETGSRLTVIESYLGGAQAPSLTNAVTEVIAADNATVEHYKVVLEGDSHHVGTTHFHQARDATVSSHVVTLSGAIVRNNITAVLDGPGGHCTLNGFYLVSGRHHVDNHLRVEHARPHCDSREFFKGILEDQARAAFSGRIIVHKDAQKTDAKQTNKNLLLSEDAQVDSRPQLEIFADDVKCTHGATIGQVDDDAVFYLRCRGLDEQAARATLIHAFADESLARIRPAPLRERVRDMLRERLPLGAP